MDTVYECCVDMSVIVTNVNVMRLSNKRVFKYTQLQIILKSLVSMFLMTNKHMYTYYIFIDINQYIYQYNYVTSRNPPTQLRLGMFSKYQFSVVEY